LYDLAIDRREGNVSLATEGVVNSKSVNQDVKYVEAGLKKFYPSKRVQPVVENYKAQIGWYASLVNRILAA